MIQAIYNTSKLLPSTSDGLCFYNKKEQVGWDYARILLIALRVQKQRFT